MAFAQTYETLWAEPSWQAEPRAWIEETRDGFDDGLHLRPRKVLELCA